MDFRRHLGYDARMDQLSIPQIFAVWTIPVLFAITVHEVSHGWVASKLGDQTARMLGRLTLNPIKHIDLIGTILVPGILLAMGTGFIFGWAKPVPVNHRNLGHPKRDMAFVAAAGPISNFLMALFWAGVLKLGAFLVSGGTPYGLWLAYMGQAGILINLVLAVLNLIPIPPLDGSRVVASLLPNRLEYMYNKVEPYGFFILVGLLAAGVLGKLIGPPVMYLRDVIIALIR